MHKKESLKLLIAFLIVFTTQPLFSQFVKEKPLVKVNSINPNLHHATNKKLVYTNNNLVWSFVKDNISMMESRHPELDRVATELTDHLIKIS